MKIYYFLNHFFLIIIIDPVFVLWTFIKLIGNTFCDWIFGTSMPVSQLCHICYLLWSLMKTSMVIYNVLKTFKVKLLELLKAQRPKTAGLINKAQQRSVRVISLDKYVMWRLTFVISRDLGTQLWALSYAAEKLAHWGLTGSLVSAGGGWLLILRGEGKMVSLLKGVFCNITWVHYKHSHFNVACKRKKESIKRSSHGVESYFYPFLTPLKKKNKKKKL